MAHARKKYNVEVAKIEARNEEAGPGDKIEEIPAFEEPQIEIASRPSAVDAVQKFTEPPPRYNEASLVKELEERGIGRPSTYASIITTIQDREYVTKVPPTGRGGRFFPTEIGTVVTNLLVANFPYIFDTQYTAKLEEELDEIEEGKEKWTDLLKGFYGHFEEELKSAEKHMENVKRMEKADGREVRSVRLAAGAEVGKIRVVLRVQRVCEGKAGADCGHELEEGTEEGSDQGGRPAEVSDAGEDHGERRVDDP